MPTRIQPLIEGSDPEAAHQPRRMLEVLDASLTQLRACAERNAWHDAQRLAVALERYCRSIAEFEDATRTIGGILNLAPPPTEG